MSAEGREDLDPRIQFELENLNNASDDVNNLEKSLDEERKSYSDTLRSVTQELDTFKHKLNTSIEKAKPYHDIKAEILKASNCVRQAASRYDRAKNMLEAAKEMVIVAEHGLMKESNSFDTAWQEMLNHATEKVLEAENELGRSETEHKLHTDRLLHLKKEQSKMQGPLKAAIRKSLPYYDTKAKFCKFLENQKYSIERIESKICEAKKKYSLALRNLECISEDIHYQRELRESGGKRPPGVGAEQDDQEERGVSDNYTGRSNGGGETSTLGRSQSLSEHTHCHDDEAAIQIKFNSSFSHASPDLVQAVAGGTLKRRSGEAPFYWNEEEEDQSSTLDVRKSLDQALDQVPANLRPLAIELHMAEKVEDSFSESTTTSDDDSVNCNETGSSAQIRSSTVHVCNTTKETSSQLSSTSEDMYRAREKDECDLPKKQDADVSSVRQYPGMSSGGQELHISSVGRDTDICNVGLDANMSPATQDPDVSQARPDPENSHMREEADGKETLVSPDNNGVPQ